MNEKPLLWLGNRAAHCFADLPASGVVAWSEGIVRVAGDDAPVVSRLYERIERAANRHIGEMRAALCVYGPLLSQHDNLAQLPSRDIVAPPECAVGIA